MTGKVMQRFTIQIPMNFIEPLTKNLTWKRYFKHVLMYLEKVCVTHNKLV